MLSNKDRVEKCDLENKMSELMDALRWHNDNLKDKEIIELIESKILKLSKKLDKYRVL